jgi:NADPH:quinone reductase-like Zn-dependent oxidoreductase
MESLKHAESGALKPTISQVLPLKDLAKGHEIMEQDEIIGKMVFVPEHAVVG